MQTVSPLLLLSVVLTAGVSAGWLARKVHLPAVTGQIIAGLLLGPSALHLIDDSIIHQLGPVTHFAIGLMAVAIGSHLSLPRLRNALRRLSLLLLLEATVTPVLVFFVARDLFGASRHFAVLMAAICVSTAPATVLAIVKETRSRGTLVKTLMAAVALNNIACIVLFEVALEASSSGLAGTAEPSLLSALTAPVTQLAASLALGGGIGVVLVLATRRVVRSERLTTASMIAILVAVGLADLLSVSTLLCCLFLGVTLANLTPDKEEIGHDAFANFEAAIFAIFFILAGAELHVAAVIPAGVLALAVFLARIAGKLTAAMAAMRLAGAPRSVRRWLGPALIPQAGLAVALLLLATENPALTSIREMLLATGLAVVLGNELVGSILVRTSLRRSGDFGKDRERLIDFLSEECITTQLRGDTAEEAIEQLVDLMRKVHRLPIERDELLANVLAREAQGSTCLGDGLAIPHATIETGGAIIGVMGISRDGLPLPTPDGRRVNCMLLLATPPSERGRHLEVLAALARAVGGDRSVQQQLYHAKSPAHAYDVLHAEESEAFNYFLED